MHDLLDNFQSYLLVYGFHPQCMVLEPVVNTNILLRLRNLRMTNENNCKQFEFCSESSYLRSAFFMTNDFTILALKEYLSKFDSLPTWITFFCNLNTFLDETMWS